MDKESLRTIRKIIVASAIAGAGLVAGKESLANQINLDHIDRLRPQAVLPSDTARDRKLIEIKNNNTPNDKLPHV